MGRHKAQVPQSPKPASDQAESPSRRPVGRPTDYRPEYAERVEDFCKLGAKDQEIADHFSVTIPTLYAWQKKYPEFFNAWKSGKLLADAHVATSLYKSATGWGDNPPNPTSCIFWLKNRRRDEWRDKYDVDQNVQVTLTYQRDPELWAAIEHEVTPTLAAKVASLPEGAQETMRLVLEDVPADDQQRVYDQAVGVAVAAAARGSGIPLDLLERQAPDVTEAVQGFGTDLGAETEEERATFSDAVARVAEHNAKVRSRAR
jgi:hypothetical protein